MKKKVVKKVPKGIAPKCYHDLSHTERVVCLILADVFQTPPAFKAAKRLWELGIRPDSFLKVAQNDFLSIPDTIQDKVYNYLRDFALTGQPVEFNDKGGLYKGPLFPKVRKPRQKQKCS